MRFLAIIALLSGCSALGGKDDGGTGGADAADATTSDGRVDADAQTTDVSSVEVSPVTCALLGSDCGANHACYPFPFDSENPSGTLCGLMGTGTEQIPCASQLDCDGQSVCSDPGQPGSVCLTRCDPSFSFCAVGQACSPLPAYRGVGVCLSL